MEENTNLQENNEDIQKENEHIQEKSEDIQKENEHIQEKSEEIQKENEHIQETVDILEENKEDTMKETTEEVTDDTPVNPYADPSVPWYRNSRLMIMIFVAGIAIYYIVTGLYGYFVG